MDTCGDLSGTRCGLGFNNPATFLATMTASVILALAAAVLLGTQSDCLSADESPIKPNATPVLPDLVQIEKEATSCMTAADAVAVYRLFLSHALPAEVRQEAEKQLSVWLERERFGLLRVGQEWLTKDELKARVKQEEELIKEGLAFLKLGHVVMAEEEWSKASMVNLQSGQAEMLLGLLDCLHRQKELSGLRHFQDASRREPTNYAACNNAAVAGFYAGRTTQIAADFRCALDRAGPGAAQLIADNIARVLRNKRLNSRHAVQLKELYRVAVSDLNVDEFDPAKSSAVPVYLFPPAWEENAPEGIATNRPGVRTDDIVYMGSGTGFVIAPEFIITNHHVVDDALEVAIMSPQDKKTFLVAEVISSNADVDLALLKCPTLSSPPIKARRRLPGRGSELMSLGYPQAGLLGLGLKSTRGAVISVPDDSESNFLHDAIVNRGNSGGPLVDNTGAIIGVTQAFINIENAYFVGIPVEVLWEFVGSCSEQVAITPGEEASPLEWPKVDELASKSTVFVKCKFKARGEENR